MSNNDFNDGYYGLGFKPTQQWALGDQMRRIHQQQQEYHKQQTERINSAPTPSYSGPPIEFGPRAKKVIRIIEIGFWSCVALAIITVALFGWW